MSLILEALKKSEAKRRLGEAPDLGTPFSAPRRRGNLVPVLFLAVVAAGAMGWWYLRKPTAAPASTPSNVVTVPANGTPPVAAKPLVQAPAPAPAAAHPERPRAIPAPTPPAPVQNGPPEVVSVGELAARGALQTPSHRHAEFNRSPGASMAGRRLPPDMRRVERPAPVVAQTQAAATPETPAAPPAPAPPAVSNSTQLAKAAKTPDVSAAAAPVTAPPAAAASTPTMQATGVGEVKSDPPKSDVPFYYELPFSIRKALPPLRLSMHVYAGDPAQRFVVLNDSRLAEGDKTADDVTLREVRKDGAVLEFQGQRFFYPRSQ
jgi:general secretion pathway protein B